MDTQIAQRAQLKQLVQKRALGEENRILKGQMAHLKSLCRRLIEQVEHYEQRRHTGWYVLLARGADDEWSCVGIIDPDDEKWATEELPAFDLIMPIPEPETMPEFGGF